MPGYRKPTPNLIVLVNQISTQECGGVYGLLGPDKLITSIKGVVFLSVYDCWLVGSAGLHKNYRKIPTKHK